MVWFVVVPCYSQTYWQFGEKIRDLASWTQDTLNENPGSSTCELCGRPTLFQRKICFHCLQQKFPHDFTEWCGECWKDSQDKLQTLKDSKTRDELIRRIFEVKRRLQDQARKDSDYETQVKREMLEQQLDRMRGPDGRPIGETARDTIARYLPALEGTDYANDPVKTLTYFLILDGKGFIRNVKCVRGPMGQPMTLLEAYEHYSGSDPQKAEDILEVIDNVRKLSDPKFEEEKIPLLLDSLGRSLRLLLK